MKLWACMLLIILQFSYLIVYNGVCGNENDDVTVEDDIEESPAEEVENIVYVTPKAPQNAYLAETFDDIAAFEKLWKKSKAKKAGVDMDISKYDGVWSVEEVEKNALTGDRGLVLKSKAKHAAIAAPLKRPFRFTDRPFIVQYEVVLQNGQECGGAYIKLLSHGDKLDLNAFHDKTPYTVMFGPDKCGNEHKYHFIFRHVNPLTGALEEKHAKRTEEKIEEPFKDKKPHLYTLVIRPDNSYEMLLDYHVVNSGNLLEDFNPPVNPPKEIDDPEDFRPDDWDEREKIPDPNAVKPDDWDDDAPMQIVDSSATKPLNWLDEEPEMIPDPDAVKPSDWDDEMDGEWEAPLINNPACKDAAGCGQWQPPLIDNPEYKGKWKPPLINNPNYQGKWTPRKISNPDYFEDLEPFKMTPIGAVGIEIWSMSDGIYFDNILITDNIAEAHSFAAETFDLKVAKHDKGQAGVFKRIIDFSNKNPWIYAVYVLLVAIPVVLIFACFCTDSKEDRGVGERKKTDAPTADDPVPAGEQETKVAENEIEVSQGEEEDRLSQDNGQHSQEEEEGGLEDKEEDASSSSSSQDEEGSQLSLDMIQMYEDSS